MALGSLGFALGWNYFFFWALGSPNLVGTPLYPGSTHSLPLLIQISAVGIIVRFWDMEGTFPRPAWMGMFIVFSEYAHSHRSFKNLLS